MTSMPRDIAGLLDEATRLSFDGPLDKALGLLNDVLQMDPTQMTASSLLADTYARLGRYDEGIRTLTKALQWGEKEGTHVGELKRQLVELERIKADLDSVNKTRVDRQGFVSRAIVPDGEGGYLVDTLGFPGVWDLKVSTDRGVGNGSVLRFMKSLAHVLQEVKEGKTEIEWDGPIDRLEMRGDIAVIDDVEGGKGIVLSLVDHGKACALKVSASYDSLYLHRQKQREVLRNVFKDGRFHVTKAEQRDITSEIMNLSPKSPNVLLVSLSLTTDYAVSILRDCLQARHIKAEASHIRSLRLLDAYIEDYKCPSSFEGEPPNIITLSVVDTEIENVNVAIHKLRQAFGDAFVLIGGPSSQTAEQLAVLVPDFDVLIKGDGDEILPQICEIIGSTPRSQGLTLRQIQAVKKLYGGILLRTKNRWISNNIDRTNVPSCYHLPRPHKRSGIHYWHTSRGCPYDCRFCNSWSGKRYRMVTPWVDDEPLLPLPKRSAKAMKEWLLERLALEFHGGISALELEERLEASQGAGEVWEIPSLKDKIFIVITDDDSLINRERVFEFCREMERLGLQRYFEFSAITSVRSFFRGGQIDKEMVDWLKQCNFRCFNIGTDGLCQTTLDQNNKGYSLDRDVIPLNKYLREQGFFVFNNVIFTTPYTTLRELLESLIFYMVCPFPINTALEVGIIGHIGTKFNNEDIVNQRFNWQETRGKDMGHYVVDDSYRITKGFKEYSLAANVISYADPIVRDVASSLGTEDTSQLLSRIFTPEEIWKVVDSWRNLPAGSPEMRALAQSILYHRQKGNAAILSTIREDMRVLNISSFVDYYSRLRSGESESDPSRCWIREHREKAKMHRQRKEMDKAERELKLIVENKPWYSTAYKELIDLLIDEGRCSEAIAYFARLQVIEPDIAFYHRFFRRIMESLDLTEPFKNKRALFHLPRYTTISPIYYFIAAVRELATGETVPYISFPSARPRDVENLWHVMDKLTVNIIERAVNEAAFDVGQELQRGKAVNFFGIPAWLEDEGKRLVFAYDQIDSAALLEIRKGRAVI